MKLVIKGEDVLYLRDLLIHIALEKIGKGEDERDIVRIKTLVDKQIISDLDYADSIDE